MPIMWADPKPPSSDAKADAPADAKADAFDDAKGTEPQPPSADDQEEQVSCPTLRGLAAAVKDRLVPSVDVAVAAHALHGGRSRP